MRRKAGGELLLAWNSKNRSTWTGFEHESYVPIIQLQEIPPPPLKTRPSFPAFVSLFEILIVCKTS